MGPESPAELIGAQVFGLECFIAEKEHERHTRYVRTQLHARV